MLLTALKDPTSFQLLPPPFSDNGSVKVLFENVPVDKLVVFISRVLLLAGLRVGDPGIHPGNAAFSLTDEEGNDEGGEQSKVHRSGPKAENRESGVTQVVKTFESMVQRCAASSHRFLGVDAVVSVCETDVLRKRATFYSWGGRVPTTAHFFSLGALFFYPSCSNARFSVFKPHS